MRIAIVDDQKESRDEIENYLNHSDIEFSLDKYESGEALLANEELTYNLVFLDIVMSGENGVKIAEKIKNRKPNTIIFFITSQTSFISNAMKNKPFQYLIKPIEEKYFLEEFNRAVAEFKNLSKMLKYQREGKLKSININDIVYIENCQRKLIIHDCDNTNHYAVGKIEFEEEKLVSFGFVRIHKSFLVNMKYIDYIDGYMVYIKERNPIPLSKKYNTELREAHRKYISGLTI